MYRATARDWNKLANSAMKQSGQWASTASHKASDLAAQAYTQAQKAYPKILSSAAALGASATALGAQARDKVYSIGAPIGDSISHTTSDLACTLRSMGRWGVRLAGLYFIAKLVLPEESSIRRAQAAVEERVRAEPVASAVVAAGLGWLIARALR